MRQHVTDLAFAEKPRPRMYFSFSISLLSNIALRVGYNEDPLGVGFILGVQSSLYMSNSAAIRAAHYKLTMLQLSLPIASSRVRGRDASGV
jgi:hypothetical protein